MTSLESSSYDVDIFPSEHVHLIFTFSLYLIEWVYKQEFLFYILKILIRKHILIFV